MPKFQTVIVCEIEAPTYEEALEITLGGCDGFLLECEGIESSYPIYDFERDNDGQRVLYLHNEKKPL